MIFKETQVKLADGEICVLKSPDPADAEVMLSYRRQTMEETHFLTRFPEEVTMTAEQESSFLEAQQKSDSSMMIGAWIGGELAGSVGIFAVADKKKLRHRATMGIAEKKKFWGKGIGKLLIREAITAAEEMGFLQLELGVFSDNERAIHVYERLGFERWGQMKNAFRLNDGTFRDEILMGKLL